MDFRIAADFAGGGLQDFGFDAFRRAQQVDGAVHAGFGGLHRVELVVDRRSGAGEVVDLIHFDE